MKHAPHISSLLWNESRPGPAAHGGTSWFDLNWTNLGDKFQHEGCLAVEKQR